MGGVAEDVALAGGSRVSLAARFGKGLFKAGVALGAIAAAVDILYQGWKIFQEVKDHCDSVKHMNEMEEATVGFYTGILDGAAKRFFHTELVNTKDMWPLRFDRNRLHNIQAYWDEIGDGLQYKNQMLKFYVTMQDGYWIKELCWITQKSSWSFLVRRHQVFMYGCITEKVVSTRRLPATLINIDVCNFFWQNRNAPISMLLFLVGWWTMFFDDFTKPLRWDLYCQHCRRIILSIYISITAPTRKRKYTAPTRKRKYTAPTRKRK